MVAVGDPGSAVFEEAELERAEWALDVMKEIMLFRELRISDMWKMLPRCDSAAVAAAAAAAGEAELA